MSITRKYVGFATFLILLVGMIAACVAPVAPEPAKWKRRRQQSL